MQKQLVLTCLINFLVAALMGLALRYTYINPIPVNYRFLTHGHSHIAMLGWVYLMLYTLFVHYFVPKRKPIFNKLFWMTQVSVVGMVISFPIQGYAAISIAFSTLHIFCSYYFVWLFWKHQNITSKPQRQLAKIALVFMLISTIGVWCLGPAVGILGKASAFYQIAIQFFLHFQFNGWFLIGVLAVLFHKLKIEDSHTFHNFYKLIIASTILTFALPIQWFAPHSALLWINGFGIVLQLLTLFVFLKLINKPFNSFIKSTSKLTRILLYFGLFCFILKITVQTLSLLPNLTETVYQQRNLVIGFIHLTMLGVISGFLFAFILQSKLVQASKFLNFGMILFILGFVLTEVLLVTHSISIYFFSQALPNYYLFLFITSLLLPFGIASLITNLLNNKTYYEH